MHPSLLNPTYLLLSLVKSFIALYALRNWNGLTNSEGLTTNVTPLTDLPLRDGGAMAPLGIQAVTPMVIHSLALIDGFVHVVFSLIVMAVFALLGSRTVTFGHFQLMLLDVPFATAIS